MIELNNVVAVLGGFPALAGVSLSVQRGDIVLLQGPNGAGKSSLLKALARKIKTQSGAVLLDGVSINELSRKELDRKVGLLGAMPAARSTETVFDLVARSAMTSQEISRVSPRLNLEIQTILERTGLTKLAKKKLGELSTGSRQVALIAAALAKNPEVLLLDEPTNSLDYSHQLQVINLLSSLKRERGMTIVAVVHDLNLAARFADRVVILKDGKIVDQGLAKDVITPNNLAAAFNILARVIEDPVGKTPLVVPIRQLD